jgi:hypothetical protein
MKLWATRYLPDLSSLTPVEGYFPVAELVESVSDQGRAATVRKVQQKLQINCQLAGIETNALLTFIPNLVNLAEVRRLAQFVENVYRKTLTIYQQQTSLKEVIKLLDFKDFSKITMSDLILLDIEAIADALHSDLFELQEQHLNSKDSRAIVFFTTQFHCTSAAVLKWLSPCERVLLQPYLQFAEEQVAIPWQQICAAAADRTMDSLEFQLAETLLASGQSIAESVYNQLLEQFSEHRSRRGVFTEDKIRASSIRDINMFQGYLGLCVLENRMTTIERELLPLCITVFPSTEVKWNLVETGVELLTDEIHRHLSTELSNFVKPYTKAMRQLFMTSQAQPMLQSIGSYV